jgi:hypothetical protein
MKSTFDGEKLADHYLGIDLTDRYAKTRKLIDVCALTVGEEDRLCASFWQWQWSSSQSRLEGSKGNP